MPGVLVLTVPWLLAKGLGQPEWYTGTFVTMALLVDAAYLLLLRRSAGSWRTWAVLTWLLGPPLLGSTTYARVDLVPGVLLGLSVLSFGSRPRWAAAAAALATAVKFWPAVVPPVLAAQLPALATPAMLGWWQDPEAFTVFFSAYNAYEVSGPGVPLLLHGAGTVLVLALRNLLLVWLTFEAWRRAWRQTEGSGVVIPASASAATISSRLIPRR